METKNNLSMKIIRIVFIIVLLQILSPLFVAEAQSDEQTKRTVLTAIRTESDVLIDGQVTEKDWNDAQPLKIPVIGGLPGDLNVTLRAMYDSENIYFYAIWADDTKDDRYKQWAFNLTGDGKWSQQGDEDRLAFIWNIGNSLEGFNIGGCAIVCHIDRKRTNEPGQYGDVWQWKASRTNPVGYVDDGFIDDTLDNDPSHSYWEQVTAAHRMDSMDEGGYTYNGIQHFDDEPITYDEGPVYYEPAPIDSEDRSVLKASEIKNGEAVLVPKNPDFPNGLTIPGVIVDIPVYNGTSGPSWSTSSRYDIKAKGIWKDNQWHVEMKRALQTYHTDDTSFDVSKTFRFGISVMDNSSGLIVGRLTGHSMSQLAYTLEFGGIGSEIVTKLTLIRDYLVVAKGYSNENDMVGAETHILDAKTLFMDIEYEASQMDPHLYMEIKSGFAETEGAPSPKKIQSQINRIDSLLLIFQKKASPTQTEPTSVFIAYWMAVEDYILFTLALLFIYPLILLIQTGVKKTWRKLSIFSILFVTPIIMLGFSHIGIRLGNPYASNFSFLVNHFPRLLWVILMAVGLVFAHYGMSDIRNNMRKVRSLNRKLMKANKQLILHEQHRSEFIDLISHELRTPLTVIRSNLELMNKGHLGKFEVEEQTRLKMLDYNVKRINDSISEMLLMSQLDSNSLRISEEKIDVKELISKTLEDISPLVESHGDELIIELPPKPPTLIGDFHNLKIALSNLIVNAIKYSPDKGKIRIIVKKRGDNVQFEVVDKGIGIKKEHITRIFEKFYVIDTTMTKKGQSIGLGLSIAKGIVEAHGGKIWVKSKYKVGSKFGFTIPKDGVNVKR